MPIEYYQQRNNLLLKNIKFKHLQPFVWDIVGVSDIKRIEMLTHYILVLLDILVQ